MKLIIGTREYDWPDTPTYNQRRAAAAALGMTVNELIDILINPERTAEREEVFAALALAQAGEDPRRVGDLTIGDISVRVEDGDLADMEDDALPPASSPADAEAHAAAA